MEMQDFQVLRVKQERLDLLESLDPPDHREKMESPEEKDQVETRDLLEPPENVA